MKKIFLLLLTIAHLSSNIGLGFNPIFDKKLSDFKIAYSDLEKSKPNLIIHRDISYDIHGNPHTSYSYGGSDEAMIAVNDYFNKYDNLRLNLYKNAFGDGFILGIFSALTNKLLSSDNNETTSSKALVSLLMSIGATCYDNKKIGQVPFFDGGALTESDNLFSNTNIHSFGRTGLTTLSLIFSYLVTHSALDKLGYYLSKEEDVKNTEKTVADTNNNSKSNLLDKFKNYFKDYANDRKNALNKIDKKKLKFFGTAAITLTTLALIKILIKNKIAYPKIEFPEDTPKDPINYLPTERLKIEEIIEEDYTKKVWPLEVD